MSNLNRKITKNKTDHLLVQNELNKLKTFDSGYFIVKSHFEEDGTQNYLVFQPINKYFKLSAKTLYILSCSLKDYLLKLLTHYVCNKIRAKFTGGCLKQSYIHLSHKSYNKLTYTYGKVVNVYIVYELSASSSHFDDPTPKNCLFGTVTLTKNADIDKYGYSGYGIGFD